MGSHESLLPFRVGVEVALRDLDHVADAQEELEEFYPEFTVSERGWTVANVTVQAPTPVDARRLAAALVVAALHAEPLLWWLY